MVPLAHQHAGLLRMDGGLSRPLPQAPFASPETGPRGLCRKASRTEGAWEPFPVAAALMRQTCRRVEAGTSWSCGALSAEVTTTRSQSPSKMAPLSPRAGAFPCSFASSAESVVVNEFGGHPRHQFPLPASREQLGRLTRSAGTVGRSGQDGGMSRNASCSHAAKEGQQPT